MISPATETTFELPGMYQPSVETIQMDFDLPNHLLHMLPFALLKAFTAKLGLFKSKYKSNVIELAHYPENI